MCGIFCVISRGSNAEENRQIFEKCCILLNSRGPDSSDTYACSFGSDISALFAGSVLWTQGDTVCEQPVVDPSGNILLWNGDVFSGLDKNLRSDTDALLEAFVSGGIEETLCKIKGPYSFIYYDKRSDSVWFGRDPLGRVSLLWSSSASSLLLSSVSSPSIPLNELPPFGVFILNLNNFEISVKPWYHQSEVNYTLPDHIKLDSVIVYPMLAMLSRDKLRKECGSPSENDFTLLKVYNENEKDIASAYNNMISGGVTSEHLKALLSRLDEAVKVRCRVRPPYCQNCKISRPQSCHHPKVGVLFSGGLDSTIIALLADKYVDAGEAIDLYNVAFEKPSQINPYNAPDRITGLSSLSELRIVSPCRTWNFVQIDVSREELDFVRDSHISKLIYPSDSVLDESLGSALWFAASGKGTVNGLPYVSSATIVLLGMGADEIFGGYRKARRAWSDGGWTGLTEELVSGLINLPIRNLGRDNRAVSDHSRVPRFPFLDEDVVSFAYSIPTWEKCYLGREIPEGVGDKLLLRLLAWKLGLKAASRLPKRALQFGSRIANSKEAGHDISNRLRRSWESPLL